MRTILLLLLLASVGGAQPAGFSSGPRRIHLLELYSSEGCSSCPPAEAWLGGLRENPGLWRDFVPVAFHVDYWDRLGWPDRLGSKLFTAREYSHAAAWGTDSVYTPCFVLDGAEWHGGDRPPAPPIEIAGVLTATRTTGGVVRVSFRPALAAEYEVTVAILGGGIVSPVKAGENEGRTLRHEFVVLAVHSAPLVDGAAELPAPMPAIVGVARHALAVWVTRRGDQAPVQAAGGWLD